MIGSSSSIHFGCLFVLCRVVMEENINLFPGQITFKSPECFPCVSSDNRDSVLGWPEPQITFPVPDLKSAQLTTDTLCSSKKKPVTGPSPCCLSCELVFLFVRENRRKMKRNREIKVQSKTVSSSKKLDCTRRQ